ncbi:MAG: hypothetical protein Harvfovirus54_7 [Harvfovirus sp.]|uniref:RING-type domain-containing protein n=1 Tax=Harvfovirus sp. TaxID=2487768 RepID=A0A3G5A3F9_9VIRU|nr:MAG: hypothetical protein Harvfovirus54_7 [Harvfovirus sp.]
MNTAQFKFIIYKLKSQHNAIDISFDRFWPNTPTDDLHICIRDDSNKRTFDINTSKIKNTKPVDFVIIHSGVIYPYFSKYVSYSDIKSDLDKMLSLRLNNSTHLHDDSTCQICATNQFNDHDPSCSQCSNKICLNCYIDMIVNDLSFHDEWRCPFCRHSNEFYRNTTMIDIIRNKITIYQTMYNDIISKMEARPTVFDMTQLEFQRSDYRGNLDKLIRLKTLIETPTSNLY